MRRGWFFCEKGELLGGGVKGTGAIELAKDVSAFANSEGGHLLIGFPSREIAHQLVDQIKGLQLFASAELDLGQISGVLRTYVWPNHPRNDFRDWIPTKDDATVGIASIYIPKQSEESKFFLITKGRGGGWSHRRRSLVGIARRVGSDNIPLVPTEIHDLIRKGEILFCSARFVSRKRLIHSPQC